MKLVVGSRDIKKLVSLLFIYARHFRTMLAFLGIVCWNGAGFKKNKKEKIWCDPARSS